MNTMDTMDMDTIVTNTCVNFLNTTTIRVFTLIHARILEQVVGSKVTIAVYTMHFCNTSVGNTGWLKKLTYVCLIH